MNTSSLTHRITMTAALAVAICAVIGLASPVMADTETFHETYSVGAGTPLIVENRNGSVTISVWDKDIVDVVAVKKTHLGGKLSDVEIQVEAGDTLRIETVYLVKNPRVSVNYTITVPASMPIELARSSNGALELTGTAGDVEARTSNGSIKVTQHAGLVDAKTSNGKITLRRIAGAVTADTSNGSVEIVDVAGIQNVETSNGSISAEIVGLTADNARLKTSNGSIKVWLATDMNADLEMKTSNGKITLHDIEVMVSEISKTQLEGRLGTGGPRLEVKTSNGSIEIHALK